MNQTSPRILIVEDNEPDVQLMKYFFSKCDTKVELHFIHDGITATDFLFNRATPHAQFTPDLILVDLNLPKKDGRELLRELKNDLELRKVPVIMISTSNTHQEVSECYGLGANAFISKTADVDALAETIHSLIDFWFVRTRLVTRIPKLA